MHARFVTAAAITSLMLLAGCTGQFSVHQTEPIRIQLEGGQSRDVRVADSDGQPQEFDLDNAQHADEVNIQVNVHQVSTGTCKIHVVVKDKDSGEELEARDIDVAVNTSGSATGTATGNATVSGTSASATASGSAGGNQGTVVQNLNVHVSGHNNIVILTQAIQGSADVSVTATGSGNASSGSGNMTTTMTTTPTY